ncbi:hypothetical protein SLS60_011022 [Paraconiothyrium brasiliense]|uniref:Phosphatidylinositol diacylglycerol-lyase n=1 Tax=Paraconiothyrium brasiliense TaxID=300254 RepID=A0ABR3QKC5_9PLEO
MSTWSTPRTILPGQNERSSCSPAVASYAGSLWCVWLDDIEGSLWYSKTSGTVWQKRDLVAFDTSMGLTGEPQKAITTPALCVNNNVLHLILLNKQRKLVHYTFNAPQAKWTLSVTPPQVTDALSSVALGSWQGQLYLAFTKGTVPPTQAVAVSMARYTPAENVGNQVPPIEAQPGGQWSPTTDTTILTMGPVSMASYNNALRLVAVRSQDGRDTKFGCRALDMSTKQWVETSPFTDKDVGNGISVSDCAGFAFAVYLRKTTPLTMRVREIGLTTLWGATTQDIAQVPKYPPVIAISNNLCYVIWEDQNNGIQFLTRDVFPIPATSQWMKGVKDDVPISRLTIPGTHDAGAISRVWIVPTQTMFFNEQLAAGIRYFDLRAGFLGPEFKKLLKTNELVVHHGAYPITRGPNGNGISNPMSSFLATGLVTDSPLLIKDVLQIFYDFLNKNPSEGIIIQIKQDGSRDGDGDQDRRFADAIWALIDGNPAYWRLDASIPTMTNLRKKIQLVCRFTSTRANRGIDVAAAWNNPQNDNLESTMAIQQTGYSISVQDHFSLAPALSPGFKSHAERKFALVKPLLDEAKGSGKDKWFINFSSGLVKPNATAFKKPLELATHYLDAQWLAHDETMLWDREHLPGVNYMLQQYFFGAATGGYGTIVMDYPELPNDLITLMIRTNFGSK